ncbi:MAG: BatA domain-containing protein [Planctomycetota bacterium]|jgi:hypothetical protein
MGELFINPWFMAGAAGATVPLIIHLLVRRRYRRVPWAAMDLLLKAFKRTNRRLRLENWIVLFLRMLAIVLIAVALARPVLHSAGIVSKIGETNRSVFLLLDDSYSMGYQRGRRTPFEEARKTAADILATLKPGSDSASLILVSSQPEIIFGEPTPELEKVKQALGDVQPGYGASDLGKGLDVLMEILAMPAVARAPNKEVYFLTDGQKLAWVRGTGGGTMELTKKFNEIHPKIETFAVVAVAGEETENLGILDLVVEDRVVGLEKYTAFTVKVANHGNEPEDAFVEFLVDGSPRASTHLSLQPGEKQSALFSPKFDTAGTHYVSARLGADSLAADNERFHAMRVRERIDVLLVDGEPASESGGGFWDGETPHLQFALLPVLDPASAEGLSIIRPEVARHFEITSGLFARRWDLVILANEGRTIPMDSTLHEALVRYVSGGGSLLIFLGDKVRAEDYNEQFWQDGEGILPLKLGEVKGNPSEPVGLSLPKRRHPIMNAFDDPEWIGIITAPLTSHYFDMVVPDPLPEGVRIAASFSSGSPAIVEKPYGKGGRVMVVGTSADTEWTDLPKEGLFLVLINEMVYYLVRDEAGLRNLLVGENLESRIDRAQYAEDISVVLPAGGRVALEPPREIAEGQFLASFGPLADPGPYELQFRKSGVTADISLRDVFCANVDPAEGDLKRVTEEFVEGIIPPEMQKKFVYSKESYKKPTAEAPGGSEIWRALLIVLLAVLVVETVLAQRFGDYTR